MSENINLWFAKDENGEIITIDKANKDNKYKCPLCGSEVIPKALNSDVISPHFAHVNKSECSGETMIHYWVKNQLIKKDDVFEVITDIPRQYVCKDILLEQIYETPYGKYKPDITIITYKDEEIFIEVNYTNKKNVEDYYSKWKHLENTVIEFNVKGLYDKDSNKINISNSFQALYYKDMIINKNDKEYISYRKSLLSKINDKYTDKIKEVEWFIDDVYRYNIGENIDLNDLANSFLYLAKDDSNLPILEMLYKNNRCQNVVKSIIETRDTFTRKLEDVLNLDNLNVSINGENRKIIDKVKNNILRRKINIPIEDNATLTILEKFLKNYEYFYKTLLKDKNNIELIYIDRTWIWNSKNEKGDIVIKLKSVIDNVYNREKYIDDMTQTFSADEVILFLKETIKLRDYVVSNENLESMFVDLFTNSKDNILSMLLANNEDYFSEVIKFIKSKKDKIKYNDYIKETINKINFKKFIYTNNGKSFLDINKTSNKIIIDFKNLYNSFEETSEKLISNGMVHYNCGFRSFMLKNDFFEKILNILNEKGFFKNYKQYKYNSQLEIRHFILDKIESEVEKNDEYIKKLEDETFIQGDIFSYFKIIHNEEIIKLSERYEALYSLQCSIADIFTISSIHISNEDITYSYLSNILKYSLKTMINGVDYNIEINNHNIMINNISLAIISDIDNHEEIIEKIKFSIDMITKNNRTYFDDKVINIYKRLVEIYRGKTDYNYNIKVECDCSDTLMTISRFGEKIASYKVKANTTFEEVIEVFSKAVREYIYGNKEE